MVVGGTGFYLDWYLYPLIDQRVFIRVRYGAPGTCPAASPKLSYWRSQAVMDWEGWYVHFSVLTLQYEDY